MLKGADRASMRTCTACPASPKPFGPPLMKLKSLGAVEPKEKAKATRYYASAGSRSVH
jgi:hypothetical protein